MNQTKYRGYILASLSYIIWGVLPMYWKQLSMCTPLEILAGRIIWSFVFLVILVSITRKKGLMIYLKNTKTRNAIILTSLLVSTNWFIFIFSVTTGHVLQASLGYYINPLISIFLGIIILREKINKVQITALLFAFIGVLYMTYTIGEFPWLSLLLATSFGLYGLFKKLFSFDSTLSLLAETIVLLPVSLTYYIYLGLNSNNHFISGDIKLSLLILFSGIATAVPLYLFAEGAKLIPLTSIGFLQYINPTLLLLLGVFMYKEPFANVHKITFTFIWIALLLYSYSIIRDVNKPS
jgi:chloramphenicol-sensitive protein RarD